ncbi:hypothetical protein [Roseibacillus persicicus]|uniref:hypothetical protein n=1 Tax=Roseibacillus persicicus TaxID=454148 RepID=UPI00280C44F4|nr:hypothetical protein [Roseibacillus persicicus]MDQ8191111.1 hypothetical protein [Roseibacillus persicicus]
MIPYKAAIPILLLTPLAIWFWGIRKYDFMTPRAIPASELRPDFASPVNREIADELAPLAQSPPETETPSIPEIDPGDLMVSPGLDEYMKDAHLGAPSLLNLAQRLQYEGQLQRSVLAYERVLDSTPSGGTSQSEAEAALAALKTSLPLWNADPAAATQIKVHLGTARTPESLSGALATLSELIRVSSGNLCQAEFQIITSPEPSQPLPALPVAMWLTMPSEDPEKPSFAVVTVAPKSDEELNDRLTHGLYRLLSRRIVAIDKLTPPPPLLKGEDPENAIVNKLTRLAWKQVLETPFQSLEAGPPIENAPGEEPSSDATENSEASGEEEVAQ